MALTLLRIVVNFVFFGGTAATGWRLWRIYRASSVRMALYTAVLLAGVSVHLLNQGALSLAQAVGLPVPFWAWAVTNFIEVVATIPIIWIMVNDHIQKE